MIGQDYTPPVKLMQKCNSEWVDENTVQCIDISEDMQGRDVVVFECPECGENHTSLRVA